MAVATGTALLIVGGITAASAVGGALINADAQRDAAREQRKALANTQAAQDAGAERATELNQPFLDVGQDAFMNLADIIQQQSANQQSASPQFNFDISQLQNDPGVKFAQDQARKSTEASAAARGGALTGGTLQELQERAIGLGGMQVNDVFNRQLGTFQQNMAVRQQGNAEQQQTLQNLAQIAQVGPQTASNLGNIAIGQAGRAGDLGIQLGNVNAAERVGQAQNVNQAIGGVTNSLNDFILLQSLMNKQPANAVVGSPTLPAGAGDLSGLNTGAA